MNAFWAHRIPYDAGVVEPADYWRGVLGPAFQESRLPELVRREVELWNQYDTRVLWRKLGIARKWAFEFSGSDPVPWRLAALYIQARRTLDGVQGQAA